MDYGNLLQIFVSAIFLMFGVDFHTALLKNNPNQVRLVSFVLAMCCYVSACALIVST